MSARTVIVGASQAGVELAVSLRKAGHNGGITLIGAESHAPYQRPPLSKAFLAGRADVRSLELRTRAFYADHHIDVVTAERVTRLNLPADDPTASGTALTDTGRSVAFDQLALTVGARPSRLDVPGIESDGVCYLRVIDDAVRLRTHLATARDIVVIGGGFIGLETAAVARSHGKNVTVVEAANRLISRSVAPVISEFYRQAHLRRGTAVHLGSGVSAILARRGRVTGVQLLDGTVLPADLVVVGVGIVPRTELAEQIGLRCDRGIVVDEYARTSDPRVVAAGDCTVLPNPCTGEGFVRLESMPNAAGQARVAAATLMGKPAPYSDVPWFWSDQYDLKLQIAGLTVGYDDHVVRGDAASERFSVLYYRNGRLLAINAVNSTADYLTVRRALALRKTIAPDLAGDPNTTLKDLLFAPTPAAPCHS